MDSILIWDSEDKPPKVDAKLVLWRAFPNHLTLHAISIPNLIEANAVEFKERYLAYVYELGELQISGLRLIDHLELRPGFSFWWMNQIVESDYGKSPQLFNAIAILAFADWAKNRLIDRIILATANRSLCESLRMWCKAKEVIFEWQQITPNTDQKFNMRRIYTMLPPALQAVSFLLRYTLKHWSLRGAGLHSWRRSQGSITFISFLANLDPKAINEGRFMSHYWAQLPDTLINIGLKTNWLHLYVNNPLVPSVRKAINLMHNFNQKGAGKQNHVTLDSFLSVRVVLRAFIDWGRMALRARSLMSRISNSPQPLAYLSPLLARDWQESCFGRNAMHSALYYNLFEAAVNSLSKQRIGVFLQENQVHEMALIHAWRSAGQGTIIGVPHSSVRFWDLRYFSDPRTFEHRGKNAMPMPDAVALNGQAATETYCSGGYPKKQIVQVEALRYQHLADVQSRRMRSLRSKILPMKLLVLGELLERDTHNQLCLLEEAASMVPHDLAITIKPHPVCPLQPQDYARLDMTVVNEPIEQLLHKCDVAYTGSITSAAIDAYLTGIPVVSMLDPRRLNLSPLRGYAGVYFVSNAADLTQALVKILATYTMTTPDQEFFTLDEDLPRWRELLT